MPDPWPFLDWPGPIPFAHRGGAREWPENTMVAFAASVALGYRYLETDVHVTADGALVAFHDRTLERVTDLTGPVSARTWAQLRRARVLGEPIPLLEDVLGTWPEARVNIDAKSDACVPALVSALQRTRSWDRVCVGAFGTRRANRARRLTGGRVCSWMGRRDIARLRLASMGMPAPAPAVPCAQVPLRRGRVPVLDQRLLDWCHARGVVVHAWVIDERSEMERLLDLGVDGIMSDRPSLLKDVFVERGLWP